jgi:PAS domain S-box-containing protein
MPRSPSDKSKKARRADGADGAGVGADARVLDFARVSADWFWETDADDRFTFISDQVQAAVGLDPKTTVGQSRQDLHGLASQDSNWAAYRKIIAAREPYRDFTFILAGPDGATFPVAISGEPMYRDGEFVGYRGIGRKASQGEFIEKLIRNVTEATSRAVGRDFLEQVAVALWRELGLDRIFISRLTDDNRTAESVIAVVDGKVAKNVSYPVAGSPCETVTRQKSLCIYPRGVADMFPADRALTEHGIEGYIGVPLFGANDRCFGLMIAMSHDPMVLQDLHKLAFEFFAGRVAAELDRSLAEDQLRRRDVLLSAIVDHLPHGLTVKAPDGRYMLINKEFTRRYGVSGDDILGHSNEERFPDWENAWEASRAQEKDVAKDGKIVVREQDRRFVDGSNHRLEIIKFPISDDDGQLMGVGALGVDITERDKWEQDARDRERVLKGYHKALDRIVASDEMSSPDAGDAFALLTRIAAETLGVERVSIWRACPQMSCIECLDLYQVTSGAHASGMVLERDHFPQYFKALQQVEVIDAHDARSDPRTAELAVQYLGEHGITSMLDAAVHVGDALKGVLCLEHVGEQREWTLEEQSLTRSLAALTALVMSRQEQQEAERQRQSIEQRFSGVVNALPSSLSLKDRDHRYVFVNKIYERNYGVCAEDAYGKTIDELGLNTPEISAEIHAQDTAVLEQGRSFTSETARVGRDGVERSALVSKFPVYDKDGNVELIATLWTDISDQKAVQKTLEDARARLRAITDNVPIMLCLKGLDGHYMEGNASFARWHGIDVRKIPGLRSPDLVNPGRAKVVEALDHRVIETGEVVVEETVSALQRRPDGKPTIFRLIKFPVYDADGNIMAVGTAMTDITEQKLAQRALEETQARLMAITDNVPIMLSLKDRNGVYQHCNSKFAEWHGCDAAQIVGKTSRDLLPPKRAKAIDAIDREVIQSGEVQVFETDTVFKHMKDGVPVILRQFKFPIRDSAGGITGVGTAMLDITDERRAERALQAHLEKLEDMVADRTVELTQEIAERRRAEADLRRSEANLRAILEKSPVGVAVVARESRRRLFVNQSLLDMFGADSGDTLNAVPMADTYVDPEDLERLSAQFDKTGALNAVEVRRRRLDGRQIWLLMHSRIVDFEGERAALVWHYDITNRKEAEEALARQAEVLEQTVAERTRELQESESLLNSIFEHLPVGVLIKDADQRMERVNHAYKAWYGVNPDELIGSKRILVAEYQTPEDAALREQQEQAVLQKGDIQTREVTRRFLDGRMHTVNVTKFPIFDEHGKVARIGSVSVDLTDLRDRERQLSTLVENVPGMVFRTREHKDGGFRVEFLSEGVEGITGYSSAEVMAMINSGNMELFHPDDLAILRGRSLVGYETGQPVDSVYRVINKNGDVRWVSERKRAVQSIEDGWIVEGLILDVTEQKLADDSLRKNQAWIRAFTDNLPIFLNMRDPEGRYLFVNRLFADLVGKTQEQFLGQYPEVDYEPHKLDDLVALDRKVLETGEVQDFESPGRFKGHADRIFRYIKFPVVDDAGVILGVGTAAVDITEKKKAEDEIRQSQAWMRAFTDNLPIYLNLKDTEGRYVFVNRLFADIRSDKNTNFVGKTPDEAFPDNGSEDLFEIDRQVLATGEVQDFESYARSAELEGRLLRFIKFPVRDDEGTVIGIGTAAMDITDKKLAENAIRESEAKLQAITQNAPMLLNLKDLEGRYQFVNEVYAQWVRKPVDEIIGKKITEIFSSETTDIIREQEAKVLTTGEPAEFEAPAISAQGDGERTMQYIKFPVRDDKGEVFGIGTAIMDVTDRKRADLALKESEARFRGLFENAPAGITIKTTTGRYLAMNKTFLDWKGWDLVDVVGRRSADMFGPEIGERTDQEDAQVIAGRQPLMKEVVINCADGRNLVTTNIKAPMLTPDGQVTGVCSFYVDVSEIREIEAQLQQAQKMEAVGRLAGGIAHDFNNLLGAMMGFNEFLIEDLPEGTPQHNFAQRVARAGDRAKQLVSQILAFSRASHGEQSVVDLNAIGEEAATLLSGTLPVTSRVVFHPSDAEVTAMTNAGQMSQVLMNLGVNANDALSGADGIINIGIERIPAGSKLLSAHEGPVKTTPEDFMEIREIEDGAWQVVAGAIDTNADHVLVYVDDTGPGIPEPVLRRIFDPFYTTKEAGKGTGLGLAVVHGIVTAHHGAVRVHTKIGEGARFEVFLPCAAPDAARAAADEVAEKVTGRGMILIVDDESEVADMVSIGLERLGYEAGVCSGGTEAIEVFGDTPDLWRAVISDQIMPDMRGMELIRRIKEIRPDVPCILCTGYSDTLTEETARAGGADAFFQKPVSASRLGRVLAELLGG